jgi:ABC-type proline/glycine betaine transport system permease subunit
VLPEVSNGASDSLRRGRMTPELASFLLGGAVVVVLLAIVFLPLLRWREKRRIPEFKAKH